MVGIPQLSGDQCCSVLSALLQKEIEYQIKTVPRGAPPWSLSRYGGRFCLNCLTREEAPAGRARAERRLCRWRRAVKTDGSPFVCRGESDDRAEGRNEDWWERQTAEEMEEEDGRKEKVGWQKADQLQAATAEEEKRKTRKSESGKEFLMMRHKDKDEKEGQLPTSRTDCSRWLISGWNFNYGTKLISRALWVTERKIKRRRRGR